MIFSFTHINYILKGITTLDSLRGKSVKLKLFFSYYLFFFIERSTLTGSNFSMHINYYFLKSKLENYRFYFG